MSVIQFKKRQKPLSSPTSSPKVAKISTAQSVPVELRTLIFLQKSTSICSFFLIAVVLTIYGLSICIPKLWSEEYKRLRTLQRYERELTVTNETLKNQVVEQAETSNTDLVYPNPDLPLFLSPSTHESTQPNTKPNNHLLLPDSPLAY